MLGCYVSASLGVRVPRRIAESRDWQARITLNSGFRAPKGWRWSPKLEERVALLGGSADLDLAGCYADIGFAESREELLWARAFVAKASDAEWCYRLTLFDARVIEGLVLPTAVGGADNRMPRPFRRDERRWRHDLQVLVSGYQREGSVLSATAIEGGGYPQVPSCWSAYEVPWGLYAGTPRAALLWGLDLAVSPYRAGESPRERGALPHALWAATMSQWAMNVAGELLAEARQAWRGQESGDEGRLWWLPGALVRGMRDIGANALCGGDGAQARQLSALLDAIGRVRWTKVDPCWVRRPQGNRVAAPIFKGGDFVPWDPVTWSLAVRPKLLFPRGVCPGPWGIEDRGVLLTGRLHRYRQVGNGLAVCPGGWGAFPYSSLRVPVPVTGRGGAGEPEPDEGEEDTMQVEEAGHPSDEAAVPVQEEPISVGRDETMCPEGVALDQQDEPMCPEGGPGGRAAKPIVVIDLDAGVMVEEVDSDGEGILPSAWNQTQFVGKEESVPLEASSTDQYWVPFVDERLLRAVLKSLPCEERLQRLEFSPVSDESLEALIDLVGEIKEIYDRPPAREPWKKQVARGVLAEVYPVTHVEVGRLRDCFKSVECARLMRRLGLGPITDSDGRDALSSRVAEIREIYEDEKSDLWKTRLTKRLLKQVRVRGVVRDSSRRARRAAQAPGSPEVTGD